MIFYTIGVYNSTEQEFFKKLIENKIDLFCDIRMRRGVRGAKYSFVNSKKLQNKLAELGIQYEHIIELAPTKEIRELQKIADKKNGEQKKSRQELGEVFKTEYINRILNIYDLDGLVKSYIKKGIKKAVFFCVEEHHKACHRSVLTERLEKEFKIEIKHL